MRMGLRPHFVYGTYNRNPTDSNDPPLLYLVVGCVVLVTTLAVFNDHQAGPAVSKLYKENTVKIAFTMLALSVYVGLFPAKGVGIDRSFDASLLLWAWLSISPKLHVYKFVGETK